MHQCHVLTLRKAIYDPPIEKTGLLGFRPGLTQTSLHSHRRWLGAGNFVFRKNWNCTIHVAKTKALISFAVTARLICAFVFAYAKIQFPHDVAHMCCFRIKKSLSMIMTLIQPIPDKQYSYLKHPGIFVPCYNPAIPYHCLSQQRVSGTGPSRYTHRTV